MKLTKYANKITWFTNGDSGIQLRHMYSFNERVVGMLIYPYGNALRIRNIYQKTFYIGDGIDCENAVRELTATGVVDWFVDLELILKVNGLTSAYKFGAPTSMARYMRDTKEINFSSATTVTKDYITVRYVKVI